MATLSAIKMPELSEQTIKGLKAKESRHIGLNILSEA